MSFLKVCRCLLGFLIREYSGSLIWAPYNIIDTNKLLLVLNTPAITSASAQINPSSSFLIVGLFYGV